MTTVKLIGEDGNIFSILARVKRALERDGKELQAQQMLRDVQKATSYHAALAIIMQYVDVE